MELTGGIKWPWIWQSGGHWIQKVSINGKTTKSCGKQNRHGQGAPNDLEYGRGVTEYGKCPETEAETSRTGGTEWPFRCSDYLCWAPWPCLFPGSPGSPGALVCLQNFRTLKQLSGSKCHCHTLWCPLYLGWFCYQSKQTWYLSKFWHKHIFQVLEFTQKKRINCDISNLKYYIFDVSIHRIELYPNFHITYACFVLYQWVRHDLILPKTESYYFTCT